MNTQLLLAVFLLCATTITAQTTSPYANSNILVTRIDNSDYFTDSLGQKLLPTAFDTIWNDSANSWSDDLKCFVAKTKEHAYLYSLDLQRSLRFDSLLFMHTDLFIGIRNDSFLLLKEDMEMLLSGYASIRPIRRSYGEFIVRKDNKEGVLDEDGETLVPFAYDLLYDYGSWDHLGLVVNGRAGILDREKNKILVPPAHDMVFLSHIHEDGEPLRFTTINNGKFGLVNERGKVLVPPTYDGITQWVEHGPDGHFVLLNNKIGLIDYNGKVLVPPIYDELTTTSTNGLVKGVLNGQFGVLDADYRPLLPFTYASIIVDDYYIRDGVPPAIFACKAGLWQKFDLSGKLRSANANKDPFILDLPDFEINHYDLEYTRICLFSAEAVRLPDGTF